jgi:hypothetical protein
MEVFYFAVKCDYCGRTLPLMQKCTELNYQYYIPTEFETIHSQRDPSASCALSATYDREQVEECPMPTVVGFTPHPEFKARETK